MTKLQSDQSSPTYVVTPCHLHCQTDGEKPENGQTFFSLESKDIYNLQRSAETSSDKRAPRYEQCSVGEILYKGREIFFI